MPTTTTSFSVPLVAANPEDTWGPPPLIPNDDNDNTGNLAKFAVLPYAPFGRSDRLGRAADFTGRGAVANEQRRHQSRFGLRDNQVAAATVRFAQPAGGGGGDDSDDDDDDNESFQLVDTTKAGTVHKRFVNLASKRRQHSQRLRQINARRQQSVGGGGNAQLALDKMGGGGRGGGGRGGSGGPGGRGGIGGGGGRGGRGGGPGGRGGGGRFNDRYGNRVDRQPSVAVQSDWKNVEEIDLGKLAKNLIASTSVPTVEDVLWCGFLDVYNDTYDKITSRQPVPLKRFENLEFYAVTTTDDPVLEKLAVDGQGQVFITDTILAHLMTCTRSVYPWDVVITKLPGNVLFFDKRDNSQLDYLTVQETAYHPPSDEDGHVNSADRLGLEATMVNQNFSQQILRKSPVTRQDMDLPNPFHDVEDEGVSEEPASVAYRYRKFQLDDKTTVVCRTELHGSTKAGSQKLTAFALNEYHPTHPSPATINWREKIDNQRGAVLANELKNNSFKLAKWTAQSLLSGADQMKIGFVSRTLPKISYEHVILGTQFYRPRDFAAQINLNEGNMWSLFRMMVGLLQKDTRPAGKYVLMRDPNKPLLTLYHVPAHTFEDDD